MKSRRSIKLRDWSVAEKLEVVQARQRGLTLDEIRGLFGISADTLYKWQEAYESKGIVGLEGNRRRYSAKGFSPKVEAAQSVLSEMRQDNPQAGVGKVQGMFYRMGFLSLARETVRRILQRNGKLPKIRILRRRNKPRQMRFFERAQTNELWQTDIMSFMIKGQYRVYLIGFMDDHSRFIVGWGLYRFQTTMNVLEVFRAAIEKHGMPKEVLSDNGRQYYTWRGKSKFTELLTKLGIRHIRSRPYHPQTLGKIESFWRNLFQECLSALPLSSFEEAKEKIGEYIDYYNFKRPHQGIGNLMPSDRFYGVEGQVKQIIQENSQKVAQGNPVSPNYTPPTYIVGNIGGKELRVVAKDAQVSLEDHKEEMVKSSSDGEKRDLGGSESASSMALSSQKANLSPSEKELEEKNGKDKQNQTAQSQREDGFDSPGSVSCPTGGGIVPTGGSFQRTLLPMDETSACGGREILGAQSPGTEVGPAGNSGEDNKNIAGKDKETSCDQPQTSQAAGSFGRSRESGTENYSPESLGSIPQERL